MWASAYFAGGVTSIALAHVDVGTLAVVRAERIKVADLAAGTPPPPPPTHTLTRARLISS
jgi:hypothetical protein